MMQQRPVSTLLCLICAFSSLLALKTRNRWMPREAASKYPKAYTNLKKIFFYFLWSTLKKKTLLLKVTEPWPGRLLITQWPSDSFLMSCAPKEADSPHVCRAAPTNALLIAVSEPKQQSGLQGNPSDKQLLSMKLCFWTSTENQS